MANKYIWMGLDQSRLFRSAKEILALIYPEGRCRGRILGNWQDIWEWHEFWDWQELAQFLRMARIFRQVYNISNFSQGLARKWTSVEIRWKVRNLTNSMFPQTAKQSKLLQLDFCVFLTLRKIIVCATTIKWWGCEDESGDFDGNGDANENGCVNKIVGVLCESDGFTPGE